MKTVMPFLIILAVAAIGACSTTPDEPTFDNPFDPNGTNPGGGYDLVVSISGQTIVMTWTNVAGVSSYLVEWQDDGGEWVDVSDSGRIAAPESGPSVQYLHDKFTTERTNWYRVTGWVEELDEDGEIVDESEIEPSTEVALDIAVMLAPVGGLVSTPSRFLDLEVLTGAADSVEVSNRKSFEGSIVFPVNPGVNTTVPWEMATTVWEAGVLRDVENRDELQIHFRTRMTGSIGMADSTTVQVLFTPTMTVERGIRAFPGRLAMVDTLQVLSIDEVDGQSLEAVERYRWDPDEGSSGAFVFVEDITPASITDPVEVHWDPLVEEPANNRIAARLLSDFGFEEVALVDPTYPLPMGEPEIEIVGGSYTESRDIQVVSTATDAGYIVLSEQADFAGATWVAWADTLDYELEDVFGTRFLFAAYNNPLLAETKVTSTLVSLVSPPARVRR